MGGDLQSVVRIKRYTVTRLTLMYIGKNTGVYFITIMSLHWPHIYGTSLVTVMTKPSIPPWLFSTQYVVRLLANVLRIVAVLWYLRSSPCVPSFKAFPTHHAFERFFIGVGSGVNDQMRFVSKLFEVNITIVTLLLCLW